MSSADNDAILSDLLGRWHAWARGFSPVPVSGCQPMFRSAVSAKGWDSTHNIAEDEIASTTLEAVDFHVSEMKDPFRSAIYMHARNCYTGRVVWTSPRLPADPIERAAILTDAKAQIVRRLMRDGVI